VRLVFPPSRKKKAEEKKRGELNKLPPKFMAFLQSASGVSPDALLIESMIYSISYTYTYNITFMASLQSASGVSPDAPSRKKPERKKKEENSVNSLQNLWLLCKVHLVFLFRDKERRRKKNEENQ